MRTPILMAAVIAGGLVGLATLGGCINLWAAYEDPPSGSGSGEPLPEPSSKELAEGMITQTYFVATTPGTSRFALRRCRFADGLAERCEIAIIEGTRVVERIPTYRDGDGEWGEQAKAARRAVMRAIDERLGRERVALTRLGTYGQLVPEEGLVRAQIEHGAVVLSLVRSDGTTGATVGRAHLPAGLATVSESYVSERAPQIYVVELAAADARDNGFVAFARVEPGRYRAIAAVGPLE